MARLGGDLLNARADLIVTHAGCATARRLGASFLAIDLALPRRVPAGTATCFSIPASSSDIEQAVATLGRSTALTTRDQITSPAYEPSLQRPSPAFTAVHAWFAS